MLLCGISFAACSPPAPPVTSAVARLPAYTAEEAALFGNTLSPSVVGMKPDVTATEDPKLPERALTADFVARMRISTITKEVLAGRELHSLRLVLEGRPLRGSPEEPALDLRVPKGSRTAALVERSSGGLVGRGVVVFVKRFEDRGEPVVRWHAEGDTEEVRTIVHRAKALDGPPGPKQTAP